MTLTVPAWLEGSLTGILVMVALGLVYAVIRITVKKQAADVGLDERGQKFQDMILKQLEDTQQEKTHLHERNRELNDRLAAAYTQTVELAMKHGSEVLAAVNQTRMEHSDYARKQDDTIKRVYSILDETKQQLARCEERDRVWTETQTANQQRLENVERIVTGKIAQANLTQPLGVTITPTIGVPPQP